ncbi:MAG: hypothetical protein HDKAJFGB_02309 [Anaerolineae bacterium]|nr:hypothetical protein [Anaerolineae bacterium]
MMMVRLVWVFLALVTASVFSVEPVSAVPTADVVVGVWERWEHVLVSGRDYASPCVDVEVRFEAVGPEGQVRKGLGFWDGERRFVFRCAFPSAGEWRWRTTCSDSSNEGLHERTGTVLVIPATGGNLFQARGFLRVSDDRRFQVHSDSTPFLWLGDTCWAAPVHATTDEWERYVGNRAAKGFSVLQVAIAPEWALEHSRSGVAPFLSNLPDISLPNPVYFRELDKKLALANDSGLVVLMVGLMETPYRYPSPEQVAVLSRYVAARYGSFEVVFSPSFDSGIHEAETLAAASAVREAAPDSLVTMHMGTGVGPKFHAEDWLSFDMFQSGHNGGNAAKQSARAVGMPAEVLALPGRKPVVNGEAIYEGDLGCAFDVRRTAWLSFLSGAVGYTAGINEVYAWEENVLALMDAPSSGHVALVGRILRQVPWWLMDPAPGRILNQPEDKSRLMAFALADDRSWGFLYLPVNEEVVLDLRDCVPVFDLLWVSPVTGRWQAGANATSSVRTVLRPPDGGDWVVMFSAPGSPNIARVKEELDRFALSDPERVATIAFGKDSAVDGLVLKSPADGGFVREAFQGVDCVANVNPERNSYFYLDVDDRLAFRESPRRMRVEVRLQSEGPLDGVLLQYDAGGPATVENIYRPVRPSWRRQEGGWTVLGFEVDLPFLGGRQNSGADFRLFLDRRLCRIASARVELEGSE